MKTVIFDLDGTLADTSGDLIGAANSCFRDLGHGDLLDPEADRLTAFHGGRAMLRLGFARLGAGHGEADIDRAYPRFIDRYAENIDTETRLYPGAIEAVAVLSAAGCRTGICTNKPEALAELLLNRLGIRDRFGALVGADTLASRKPDPAPYVEAVRRAGGEVARSLLVGDTETDVRTARAAGVPVVLVGFGPEGDAVARFGPDALIAGFDRLPGLVAALLD